MGDIVGQKGLDTSYGLGFGNVDIRDLAYGWWGRSAFPMLMDSP
jgi:hypothetical protein